MTTGLIYLLASVVLASVLPRLAAARGHDEHDDAETYRYSIALERGLFALVILAGVTVAVVFLARPPAVDGNAWARHALSVLGVGLPALVHAFVFSYRVRIDARRIDVGSAFGRRSVELAAIASIVMARGRGADLVLYGRDGRRLATIGGSIQDVDSLLATLELRTRSADVMLYRSMGLGCEEKPNDPHAAWRPSKGLRAHTRALLTQYASVAIIVGLGVWAASTLP